MPHFPCNVHAGCTFTQEGKDGFICDTGGILHICTETLCNERFVNQHGTITCGISGRCYKQMVQEHPYARVQLNTCVSSETRSRDTKRRRRKRNPFKTRKTKGQFARAKSIIHTLLYSSRRQEVNNNKRKSIVRSAERRVKRYKKQCDSPKREVVTQMFNEEVQKARFIPSVTTDPSAIESYAHKITRCWLFMGSLPYGIENCSHIHFDDHVLGMLYLSQYGLCFGDIQVVSKDNFLWTMLPPIQDLKHYGFPRKLITVGKNHIYKALRQANEDQLSALSRDLR
jgi:hypothetical protein